jgi:isoleucyl-tRNA synthetase
VVLDTNLTPALVAEGIARDFVRAVQDARRQADLRIEQLIDLQYDSHSDVVSAVAANDDYVKREVLASSVTFVESLANQNDSTASDGRLVFDSVRLGNYRATLVLVPSERPL